MKGAYSPYVFPELPPELLQDMHDNKSLKGWHSKLPDLGFEVLFSHRYVTLTSRLQEAFRLLEYKKKHNELPLPKKLLEYKHECWRHPNGLIASVSLYKEHSRSYSGGVSVIVSEPEQDDGDWSFSSLMNSLHIVCVTEDVSLKDASDFTAHGVGVKPQSLRLGSSLTNSAQDWKNIKDSVEAGHIIPISKWEDLVESWNFLENFETHMPLGKPSYDQLSTPSARYQFASRIQRKHVISSSKEILASIDQWPVPQDEKLFYRRQLAKHVLVQLTEVGKTPVVPSWIKKEIGDSTNAYHRKKNKEIYNQSLITSVLLDFNFNEQLTQKEREISAFWISVANDQRHPRLQRENLEKAFNLSLDRFGIKFQHILFKGMNKRSYWVGSYLNKLLWWQSNLSDEEKIQMSIKPEADGKTLPMRWVETMYAVQDEAFNMRKRNQRFAGSERALADILNIAAPQDLVFVSDTRSVWDKSIPRNFYIETDHDLVVPHKMALVDTLSWFNSKGIPIPDSIFIFGNDKKINFSNRDELVEAIDESIGCHPTEWRTKNAELHMGVIECISAIVLENNLNKSSGPATNTRRKAVRI